MIGKIARSGSDFLGALSYCRYDRSVQVGQGERKERGELVYRQMLDAFLIEDHPDLTVIAAELGRVASLNSRTQKPVCHVSLSFPPGEQPDRETLRAIVLDFAEEFGLWENGLLAYLHRDKQHEHLHIIANKINVNGKNTFKSSFNYLTMGHFCRRMEHKFGLQKVKQMDALKIDGKDNRKENMYHDQLRVLIDELIPHAASLPQLQSHLLRKGYKSIVGNGITFVHTATGIRIKGSELGRAYSRHNLVKRLSGKYESSQEYFDQEIKTTEVQRLRGLIRELAPKSSDFKDFRLKLNREGYGIIVRDKVNPHSGRRYTTLLFTKEFAKSDSGQKKSQPKILSAYQLGPEFRYATIEMNFNRPQWEGNIHTAPLPEHSRPLPPGNETSIGLENLLTPANAARVEAEAQRGLGRWSASKNQSELEGRSEEEKRAEERKIRKNRRPRRSG